MCIKADEGHKAIKSELKLASRVLRSHYLGPLSKSLPLWQQPKEVMSTDYAYGDDWLVISNLASPGFQIAIVSYRDHSSLHKERI